MDLYRSNDVHEDTGRCGNIACARVYYKEDVDKLLDEVLQVFGNNWSEEAVNGEWALRANALLMRLTVIRGTDQSTGDT